MRKSLLIMVALVPLAIAQAQTFTYTYSGSPVPIGTTSGPAKFVFVTTEGTIHAWRANTAESMDRAVIVKDYSDHGPDQIRGLPHLPAFTGVAMSTDAKANNRLYVTDFQNSTIRVLDNQWADITASVPFARPASVPAAFPVRPTTARTSDRNGPMSRTISSLSPLWDRTRATSSGWTMPRSP